jgi:CRISPR-associated protein Cas1
MQLIIDTANTHLSVKSKSFYIEKNEFARQISPKRITSIAITTNCNINASAIKLAAINEIPIYFFNHFGTLQARMSSPYFSNIASLRKKQILFYNTPGATNWIIEILHQKVKTQIETIEKLQKRRTTSQKNVEEAILKLKKGLEKASKYQNTPIDQCRNNLLGIEGSLSNLYFKTIRIYLPEDMKFTKRTRRPAQDYFNAALNYLYGMTYSVVESGVFAKGLDPFLGYMHTDNYLKTSLVFDLIEPIRPLIDRMLIDIVRKDILKPVHFIPKKQGYWLSKEGKRLLIPSFNDYLYQRIKYRGKIRRLKDIIYSISNDLGNRILTIDD